MLPLHMPGHKRSDVIPNMKDIYGIDITEIDGFDDLHEPTGIIAETERRAAKLYGASSARISVNGSTAALEAAILTVCHPGDEIIIPRASHKSIYHAIEIGHLRPVYISNDHMTDSTILLPPTSEQIRAVCLAHPDAKCVVITTPTYEGLIPDISGIAGTVHSYGMILIADSAHGAHLGFGVGESALKAGADIAVVSLHKMLPAPTQTALLLSAGCSDGQGVGPYAGLGERLGHYMQVFQSSSPSYVLMAGIDECLGYMEDRLADDHKRAVSLMARFRADLSGLKMLDVSTSDGADPLKVIIRSRTAAISGRDLYMGLISDHHIQCEMYGADYVLAMFSPVDEESSFDRLKAALIDMEKSISAGITITAGESTEGWGHVSYGQYIPVAAMTASEAYAHDSKRIGLDESLIGRISASYICVYPPGVPVIVPGEIIDAHVYGQITDGLETGLHITGLRDGLVSVMVDHE